MGARITMKISLLIKLALVLILISFIGCGSGSTSVGSRTGSVTAQLQWIEGTNSSSVTSSGKQIAAAPQGVVTVRIAVSAPDMSNIQKDFPASDGKGVIDGVPVGSNRTLTAQGLNASGVVTHQGLKNNITVQSGQTTDAGIVVMVPIVPETFAVSGKVTSDGVGLGGVTVTLSGSGLPSATTGSDGTYSFTAVQNGLYTVTPSKTGYTFTPANRSVTVGNGDVTGQDFTATPIPALTFTISGKVTLLNSGGLPGVTVSLQGTSFTTVTGSDGTYSLTGVPNGSYTVIPSKTGYTFAPANRSVSVNNGDVTGQDFTATLVPALHAISGTITLNGGGLSGVAVSLAGTSPLSFTTGADGTYTFTGVQDGLYTVIPSKAGYAFTPANRSVSVNNSDVTGQDFAAAAIALPSGFPSNVPTGNYRIDVQVCVQTPQGNSCQPVVVGTNTIANEDINQFAQALLDALGAASANACSQMQGGQCTFTISYTPWNGTSFSITDTFTITTNNVTQSVSITYTITKV